ncbi:MAG: hypothetical protein KC800_29190 [Candidatus Eremiobacteraeota bacterium]|nr:hypothetical protein [Candidatus Eremiobacteraeota bacterium]
MAESEFDLGRYLNEQASEGALDSQGEFTVDQARAARKLARFSMPHEYSWVLKLIQAAVGWESGEVRVHQHRLHTTFTFVPGSEHQIPTAKEVVSLMLQGQLESQEPLNRLCIALRSLVEQTGLSFVVGLCLQEGEQETLFAGPDVSGMNSADRKGWVTFEGRGVRVAVSHQMRGEFYTGRYAPRFMQRKLRDVEIAEQLIQNAFTSPIPIFLDERSITDPIQHPEIGFTEFLRPLFILGMRSLNGQTFKTAGPFEDGLAVPVRSTLPRLERMERRSEEAGGWVVVQVLPPEVWVQRERMNDRHHDAPTSHALWVQDGVVVERTPLLIHKTSLARFTLILDATGLETDLTGFSLKKTDEKGDRFAHGLIQAKKLMKEAVDGHPDIFDTSRDSLTEEDRKYLNSKFGRLVSRRAVLTLPFFLWNPLLAGGVLAGGLLLHGVGHLFPQVEAAGEKYREATQKAIRRLAGTSGADF